MKTLIFTLLAALLLTSCGIKPKKLSSPIEGQKDEFPRVYPNPATDAKPVPK